MVPPNGTSLKSGSSTSSKRKRSEPKFYAVRVGSKPGIYTSWNDCRDQITGFKNALFKSFPTLTDAEAFMRGDRPTSSSVKSSTSTKYYAVRSGHAPGIYNSWGDAQQQIAGFAKPKHKSFLTRAEAEAYMAEAQSLDGKQSNAGAATKSSIAPKPVDKAEEEGASKSKKRKQTNGKPGPKAPAESAFADVSLDELFNDMEPGTAPLLPDAEDGFDRRLLLNAETGQIERKTPKQIGATKRQATESKGPLIIYTDGSSLGNGQKGAVAGWGIYFGPNNSNNRAEPLEGDRQTNQRAELTAVKVALQLSPIHRHVIVRSDSDYSIKCVTVWFQAWRNNGWLTSSKKPVENRDLIEAVISRCEERDRAGVTTKFEWVKGHANDPGNNAADLLANQGAMKNAQERNMVGG